MNQIIEEKDMSILRMEKELQIVSKEYAES